MEIPIRPTEIRRNRHLLGAVGRNSAPHGSVVDCVESSGCPGKSPLFADPPPGRFFGEWERSMEISTRESEILGNRHLIGDIGSNFAPRGAAVDCVESAVNPEKSPTFADMPPGRFCGEGGAIQGNPPTRPTEIRRNRHIPGEIGRNFAPRGSVVDCVESSGDPEKSPRVADPPPGRFCGKGATFCEISAR